MHTFMALQMITIERSCVQLIVEALPKLFTTGYLSGYVFKFQWNSQWPHPFIVKEMYTRRGVVNVYFKFICLILIHGNRF